MNRKDVKWMIKDYDNLCFIVFIYKLILSLIVFFFIFMVVMVLGVVDILIKDVWLVFIFFVKGDKIFIIWEICLLCEVVVIFVGVGLVVFGVIM